MGKKSLMYLSLLLLIVFLWLLVIGQASGISALYGDIGLIDEGQYAAWVNHMLRGKLMYRDFYLPYGPLHVYILYILVKYVGISFFFIRLWLTTVGVFLGICISVLILFKLRVTPIVRGITTVFLLLLPGVGIRNFIGIFCIWLVWSSSKKAYARATVAGIMLAVSVLQSIEVGLFTFCVVFGYFVFRLVRSRKPFEELKIPGVTFLGLLFTFLLFAVFANGQGWLGSYIETTTSVITSASGVNLANGQGLPSVFVAEQQHTLVGTLKFLFAKPALFYWSLFLLLIFLSIILIRAVLRISTREDGLLFLIICFGLLSYGSIVGRSGHNLLFAPLILLCGSYFLSLLLSAWKRNGFATKVLCIFATVLFLAYGCRYLLIYKFSFLSNIREMHTMNTKTERVMPLAISSTQARNILALQEYIDSHSKRTDTIFIFSSSPAFYFLFDRENPTKYDLPFLAYSQEKRREIVRSLRQNPPKFILEDSKAWAVDEVSDRQRLPEVISYILQHYNKSYFGDYAIYTQKNDLSSETGK